MSAGNVALVRGIYHDFARGDVPAVLAALDPEVQWVENAFTVHHVTHVGPGAVASQVFGAVMSRFDDFAVVPESIYDAGEHVVVEGRVTGTTKDGRALDAPAAWVWTVRGGKAVRNMNYHDTSAWQQALSS